ncbi:uncharacterized protein PAC_10057 [Phialocephala subalpina]|uniref:ASX DEUBAD domain-containing protein n=1 Tax=Phialocephala subalpina TaxID=576137 RepID=A0A1L7X560_9HELO|nr:uncharacterized protein PAC_10057 [Phialocephala subalpina]
MQRSSARKRTATKQYDDDGYGEKSTTERPTKSTRTTRGKTRRPKTAEELLADPDHEWYDSNSTSKVKIMFMSEEAKRIIEEKRPDLVEKHRQIIKQSGRADRAIANFQRDGRNGFHDPEWQRQAREAFRKHNAGEFDEYIKWKLYQDWPELEEIDKAKAEAAEAEEEAREQEQEEQDAMLEDELQTAPTPKSVASQNGENGVQESSPRHGYMSDQVNNTDPPKTPGNGNTYMNDAEIQETPSQDMPANRFNYYRKGKKNDDDEPIMFSPSGNHGQPDRWYAVKSASRTPSRGNDQQNGSLPGSHDAMMPNSHQHPQVQQHSKQDAMDLEDSTDELQR